MNRRDAWVRVANVAVILLIGWWLAPLLKLCGYCYAVINGDLSEALRNRRVIANKTGGGQ